MKKRLLLPVVSGCLALCLFFAAPGYGQSQKHSPEERAKIMTEKMKTGVSLSDDQYSKVYELNLTYLKKMQDLRKSEGTKDEKRNSFKSMRQEKESALSAILSKEQLDKYKAVQQEQRKKMRSRHRDGSAQQS